MYNKSKIIALAVASISFLVSCNKDDNKKSEKDTITIELHEVGEDNSGIAIAGDDLHLDGEITASAKIAKVEVELRHETNTSAPKIHVVYNDFDGQLNAHLHKHIDIPAGQPTGDYHLHVVVTDRKGNTKEAEAEVKIQ